jgi:hypothetical protein
MDKYREIIGRPRRYPTHEVNQSVIAIDPVTNVVLVDFQYGEGGPIPLTKRETVALAREDALARATNAQRTDFVNKATRTNVLAFPAKPEGASSNLTAALKSLFHVNADTARDRIRDYTENKLRRSKGNVIPINRKEFQ